MADGSSYSFNQKRKRRNPLSSSTTKSSLLIWPHAHCCGQSTGWDVVLGREEEFPYEKRVQGRQNPRQICQQGLPSVIRGSLFGLLQGWIWRRETWRQHWHLLLFLFSLFVIVRRALRLCTKVQCSSNLVLFKYPNSQES